VAIIFSIAAAKKAWRLIMQRIAYLGLIFIELCTLFLIIFEIISNVQAGAAVGGVAAGSPDKFHTRNKSFSRNDAEKAITWVNK
jgi:hypothetical protein